jgi:hypothetical protein
MKKKNLLNGFKLEKLPEISNGLIIPTGNDIRPKQIVQAQPTPEPVRQAPKPKTVQQPPNHNFGKLNVDFTAFTPMTNVVPTIEGIHVPTNESKFKGLSRRARQRVTHLDMNVEEFGALPTKQDKIVYLSMRGWSLKTEARGNNLYHYATKYVRNEEGKLDKKRLSLGSVNRELSEPITVRSIHLK